MSSKKRAKLDAESEDNGPVDSEEVSADEETGDEGEDDDLSNHSSLPSDMVIALFSILQLFVYFL